MEHKWKESYSKVGSVYSRNYGFVECEVCKNIAQNHKKEDLKTKCNPKEK